MNQRLFHFYAQLESEAGFELTLLVLGDGRHSLCFWLLVVTTTRGIHSMFLVYFIR